MTFGSLRRLLPQFLLALSIMLVPAALRAEPAPVDVAPGPLAARTTSAADASSETALGGDETRTRFLIGLERSTEFQVFSLSNPNRVIVDLPQINMQLPPDTAGRPVGLVSAFRAGVSAPGKSRIVIEVKEPVVVESAKIENTKDGKGHRLALEIVPVGTGATKTAKKAFSAPYALGAAGLQPPLPLPAVRPDVKAAKAFKPVIVIDPGHGGHDSGAIKNGTVEKDVVLAFSKVLKQKIDSTGRYKVVMTRDKDVFVELGERNAFAERNKANLFIAVHADYAGGNTQARGAAIYSLRNSLADSLERSAKGDLPERVLLGAEAEKVKKASVDGDIAAVKDILADLAGRELDMTKERTSIFSQSIIEFMGASTTMRGEPDQQAGFRVLKTAQFPSVLIELAYVTNKEDAERLRSDAWRDKVADSIATAVDTYFNRQIARLPM
ncbi:MAG TPA: N-acetylmuramoyl-L-alanine amidase [Hyphomicrobiaceae bacterium]|nr:N-acetylmuramoyl-L-alanine amidase [Hyphomicrobiaceae bacterium]